MECDGQPIGFMGLSEINNDSNAASLFILIGEDDFRGKGLGKESMAWLIDYARTQLGLGKLELEVHVENLPAIGSYNKLGFKEIGQSEGYLKMLLDIEIVKVKKTIVE